MPAYMIVTVRVHDRERFLEVYGKPTAALIQRYGGRYLVRGPGCESYEGPRASGLAAVVSEWPSKAAIEAFWNSPDYQVLKAARQGLAEADVQVLEVP
ncbi:hypothetical protein PbB2_00244 [Candidatus Phycosocius bacilliformis]|uniref:DUF1330 domain-containing protein n=1 Tax=Candidatus Phycosocius bacilliformis TaxID=1445552 RepID=A0A2P2E6A7_9PROT|nr:DUF1330 domain-containing protein [Candidatus Phycosocius bacilliformis]GBF56587.1 hypothetical protein PbB2_00244 [Candidatus Phycosocius bacilliformis]